MVGSGALESVVVGFDKGFFKEGAEVAEPGKAIVFWERL